jgi:methylase of polypeptide subunit release factors
MTDEFNPELCLIMTPSEDMIRAKEGFSLPGAIALVKQLRLPGAHATAPKLLDLGTGLGQITEVIKEQEAAVEVIAGDKNEDMLEVIKGKKEAEGWGDNVVVQQMDAMVCFPTPGID